MAGGSQVWLGGHRYGWGVTGMAGGSQVWLGGPRYGWGGLRYGWGVSGMAGGSQVAVAGEKRLYLHEFLKEELHKLLSCIQTVHVFH